MQQQVQTASTILIHVDTIVDSFGCSFRGYLALQWVNPGRCFPLYQAEFVVCEYALVAHKETKQDIFWGPDGSL